MHRFLTVIEKAGKNYSAQSPDLTGCRAIRKNAQKKLKERIYEAIQNAYPNPLKKRRNNGPKITCICILCCVQT
jgi:predicted RNase H-like HicB family nuclease